MSGSSNPPGGAGATAKMTSWIRSGRPPWPRSRGVPVQLNHARRRRPARTQPTIGPAGPTAGRRPDPLPGRAVRLPTDRGAGPAVRRRGNHGRDRRSVRREREAGPRAAARTRRDPPQANTPPAPQASPGRGRRAGRALRPRGDAGRDRPGAGRHQGQGGAAAPGRRRTAGGVDPAAPGSPKHTPGAGRPDAAGGVAGRDSAWTIPEPAEAMGMPPGPGEAAARPRIASASPSTRHRHPRRTARRPSRGFPCLRQG